MSERIERANGRPNERNEPSRRGPVAVARAAMRLGVVAVAIAAVAVAAPIGPPQHAAAADGIVLVLTDQPFAVAPNATWTATFRVIGDLGSAEPAAVAAPQSTVFLPSVPSTPATTPTAQPAPRVEAEVRAYRPITDRATLERALTGRLPDVVARVTVPATLSDEGGQTTLAVSVPTAARTGDPQKLAMARTGLYPLSVELRIDGEPLASHDTFIERLSTTAPRGTAPINVAIVAAVGDPGARPSAATLSEAHDELARLAATASAVGGPMTVQIPPVLVEGLAAEDPALLATLQRALTAAEVLALPRHPLDPSSADAAGLDDAFSRELRAGEDLLGTAIPSSPPQRSAWVTSNAISRPAAAMLRDPLGYDLIVVDRSLYDDFAGSIGGYHDAQRSFVLDVGGGDTLPGLIPDPASRWLDRRQLDADGIASTDGAVRIMADLIVARRELGPGVRRSAILKTPAGVMPDAEVAGALAGYVAAVPDFRLAPLSALAATTDAMEIPGARTEVVRLPDTAGPDLTERAHRIEVAREYAAGAGSMLRDGQQLGEWNADLDALQTTGLDDDAVEAALQRVTDAATEIYNQVEAPRPFSLTLTGRRSSLRLNLRNNGSHTLRVVVRPSSPKLRFPEGDKTVDLLPGGPTEVVLPVIAQSNGTAAIGIEVVSPVGGREVEGPVVLTARVNALSGLGQVVTGGALLVLVSWWYGHFRRRRRARRAQLGEVDNPIAADDPPLSPDAAEATARPAADSLVEP